MSVARDASCPIASNLTIFVRRAAALTISANYVGPRGTDCLSVRCAVRADCSLSVALCLCAASATRTCAARLAARTAGTFVLFESRGQFRVTMTLMAGGPKAHFIRRVDVTLFDEAGRAVAVPPLSIWTHGPEFIEKTRQLVAPFGARVGGSPTGVIIDTDQGVRFVVSQHKTAFGGKQLFYVNIDADVPACSETYDGILGQLYHCRYEFVWHDGDEEAFRVTA